jgi:hypothetical protein
MKFALLFIPVLLVAQTPRPRGPMIASPADEIKLDNDLVRVIVDTELPFETEAPRQHPMNRVLIYLDDAHINLVSDDGRVEDIDVKANDIRWSRPGAPYIIENHSGHPLRIVEIQLKKNTPGSMTPADPKLDPTEVDREHYRIEYENPQVRVLRVHFEPHYKSPVHKHLYNRVVYYLNDQGSQKAGDIRMIGPQTHSEENLGDSDADRIAIEIK